MSLHDELNAVRRRQTAARQAAEGGGNMSATEAAIRAALDYAIEPGMKEFQDLEAALGADHLDAGSFLIGMQAAAMAMQGMNFLEVLRYPRVGAPLFREYMGKAREAARR